ncbi:cellulose synthase-like protein G3 [Pistacia vera]|uniref:cellulose synthase-like protein G3 n=1 Tax=Pistacia vera TaxID=55513 RepID=UPI001262EEC2|nr:cellulose synthase-like protein G3 [Pistacia vera]
MENSLPLHLCHVHKFSIIINRTYTFLHCIAIAFLIYYRASFLCQEAKIRTTPLLPWLLVFAGELVLSFMWLVGQAYRWRPVYRTVFPERLPEDDNKFPAIDVFICTADPKKEPTVEVMNTVLSAMALDYPPEKLHVYLSDDGGASITLTGMKEAFKFARSWLPFCKKYGIKTICPKAYFSSSEYQYADSGRAEFMEEMQKIKEKYEAFKERVLRAAEKGQAEDKNGQISTGAHPSLIEVINEKGNEATEQVKMPLLVYVSREKRPSHPHHFKAGALNVLLRVSGVISNSPYMLVLDCDMYCNDPTSARQAMCFHFDPKISPSLAFVQFPQTFHNLSKNDIYDSEIRSIFRISWYGLDGLKGPVLSGTNFYIKREALYGISLQKGLDLIELKNSFGQSNEFLKSLRADHKSSIDDGSDSSSKLLPETKVLASCAYEENSKWGEEVGFMYHSLVEDYFTGFKSLHCKGWKSVYLNPSRPQFLGTSTTNLNDLLTQGTRWGAGLAQVLISKFSPLIYGPPRMSLLASMGYAELASFSIYFFPLWCFATIPQLCLLNGISLFPEVSDSKFYIFLFIFLSSLSKHLYEVLKTGGSIRIWRNEQRIWMIKGVTCYFYGTLNAIMSKLGLSEASFVPTNKADDDEQAKRYLMGRFDFQTSTMFLAPLVTLTILNIVAFFWGVLRMIITGDWEKMFAQVLLSFYLLIMGYAIIEGMFVRKDTGRIPPSMTILSTILSVIFLSLGSIVLMY